MYLFIYFMYLFSLYIINKMIKDIKEQYTTNNGHDIIFIFINKKTFKKILMLGHFFNYNDIINKIMCNISKCN